MLIANRGDGLGERLCAIMNCALLAHYSGRDFKFAWPTINVDPAFHSIYDVNEIFAESFIKKHFIPEDMQQNGMHIIDPREESLESIAEKADSNTYFATPQGDISRLKGLEGISSAEMAAVCRETVLFSDRVLELKRAVDDVPQQFFDQLIHLRSGDILYGSFRNRYSVFKKVIPAPIAAFFIEKGVSQGREVRLVGQEKSVSDALSSRYGLLDFPASLQIAKNSSFNDTFIDIFQFCRANQIFSGGSGFTRFSHKHSSVDIRYANPAKAEILDFVSKEISIGLSYYGKVQLAQGVFAVYDLMKGFSAYEDLNFLLQESIRLDPRPIYYLFDLLNRLRFKKDVDLKLWFKKFKSALSVETSRFKTAQKDSEEAISLSLSRHISEAFYGHRIEIDWTESNFKQAIRVVALH